MTPITIDRAVVEQALEALKNNAGEMRVEGAISILETALAQQDEPVEPVAWMRPDNRVAEESYSRTQFSRGRDKPPIGTWTPLYPAPPQRKPVAWRSAEQYSPDVGSWFEYYDEFRSVSHTDGLTPLYTAPPQRKPLTEEEIDKIFKHLCNTVGASCKTMARAVERAHGIKE